jgi:hypothetical protein
MRDAEHRPPPPPRESDNKPSERELLAQILAELKQLNKTTSELLWRAENGVVTVGVA